MHGRFAVSLLCRKRKLTKTPNPGALASPEYISDTGNLKWQPVHPPRSSVVIPEIELQPMMSSNAARLTPMAIQAPGIDSREPLQKDTIQAAPETVAKALETTAGLNFDHYYKKKQSRTSRRATAKQ